MSRCPVVKGGKRAEVSVAISGGFGAGSSSNERLLSVSTALAGADRVAVIIIGMDNSGSSSGYVRLYLEDANNRSLWNTMLASTMGVSVGHIVLIIEAEADGTATVYNSGGNRLVNGVSRFRLYGSRTCTGQFASIKA